MFENYNFKIYYNVNGSGKVAEKENEHFSLKTTKNGESLKISIQPKQKMELVQVEITSRYAYNEKTCVMANGYQSWTETREFMKNDKMIGLRWPCKIIPTAKKMSEIYGDYTFKAYPKTSGVFHGYTFSYVRNGSVYELIGSLSERSGYTIINFDMNNNFIKIEKEVEGLIIDSEYQLYDLVFIKGGYDEIFDKYFKHMNIPASRGVHSCGYTSWYNYFTNINEDIILRDLEGICKVKDKVDIYQIDDGHQTAVGDWEITDKKKFPNGMKYIADKIHEKGLKAGLWMAPFYCQKNSKVAKEHPDWLVRGKDSKPGFVGFRNCYTLDIYNKDCANYIKQFFNTVLNDWGYDMVKLDFLYTQCLVPRNNKTRGEIMCDAMDLLRECAGDKLILGCGVPLGPSFGKVDYCRIGSDVDIKFKPRKLFQLTNNEVVSTQTALKNTIFRRGLNGRAFGNDPDVFFIRDININFTEDEKLLLSEVNKTFGNLLFVSDNVNDFSDKQLEHLKNTYKKSEKTIDYVDYLGDNGVEITYTENKKRYIWKLNWLTGENIVNEIV